MSFLTLKKPAKSLVETLDEKAASLAATAESARIAARHHNDQAIEASGEAVEAEGHFDAVNNARALLTSAGVTL